MAIVEDQIVDVKWNNANRKTYEQLGYTFTNSGELFEVDIKHLTKGSHSEVKYSCDFCKGTFTRQRKKLNKPLNFCTHECSSMYNAEIYKSEAPHINCLYCGSDFRIKNHQKGSTKFCSRKCQGAWTSENKSGENSPLYVERLCVNCTWCGQSIERTKHKLQLNDYHFCNKVCKDSWHKTVYLQRKDFKDKMKIVMTKNLVDGKIKQTKTKPHKIINEILDELSIKYINEFNIDYYSVDIYLPEHGLFIEINGGYWHCDNRDYKKIETIQQIKRIRLDKSKLSYIKNKFEKPPLYLWESDVIHNKSLCISLINKFIASNGEMNNYHSFNYSFTEDCGLKLNQSLLKPYMEWTSESLDEIIDIGVKKSISNKQIEKHITFLCDNCGSETTQYIKKYNKCKTHCCSLKCTNEYRKQKVNSPSIIT